MIRPQRTLLALVLCLLCAAPAGAQSVASLFTSLPGDFAHLFTPSNAIILGIGGGGTAAVHPKDDDIAGRIQADTGARKSFFKAGASIGDGAEQGAFALGMYIIGRASHSARVGALGADLVDAQIVNGVLTQGLKFAVDRTRPNGSSRSFPSGHTSATFATAAVIQEHYGWKVAVPFYALGGYVSVSRMVDRQHFASDVIFGAALGIVSGRAASVGHGLSRVTASPRLMPGAFAIVGTIGPSRSEGQKDVRNHEGHKAHEAKNTK
jgi:membrane-associated phospholipid phosphatase